jgi:iron complex outermembrane receptor protein
MPFRPTPPRASRPHCAKTSGTLARRCIRARGSSRAVLTGVLSASLLAAFIEPARADPAAAEIGEVFVTGSRIPADVLTSIAPVIMLERADIEPGNPASLGQVLQSLPVSTGSPSNTNVNNGGDGSTRVDLRGLGPARTLVLLNGRRLPNGGIGADASVDLDSLPLSMVERTEVLTNGASAIYGADAVAGVVNVITRHDFSGIALEAHQALASHGDGPITQLQVLGGSSGPDGAQGMAGLDYTRQNGVTFDRRRYSAQPLAILDDSGTPQFFGSLTSAYGPIRVPEGNALGLGPGRYLLIAGRSGRSAADYTPLSPAGTFNFEPYNYAQTPNERASAWLQGTMPARDGVTAFAEGLWSLRRSSQRLAPTPYSTDTDFSPPLADGSFGIPATNYYNPFGIDLPLVRRRFVELDDRGYDEDVRMWRALAGVRSTAYGWRWEVSASYAMSTAVTRESGVISIARLLPAIGPSGPDGSGRIVCGARDTTGVVTATNVIAGCVPVDLFGGPGTITPEQLANLQAPLRDRGSNSQHIVDANAAGTWGSLNGRPIEWALGATYRREAGRYDFDPLRGAGVAGSALQADVPGGSFNVREVYAETRATLLHDIPLLQRLDVSTGARTSHFSDFGSHTAWQSGLRWQVAGPLSIRASYAQVFRAPSIAELYQAQVRAPDATTPDPCGNEPGATVRLNCAAHGVPGGSYVQPVDGAFLTLAGGNPHLGPERGASFDTGINAHWGNAVRARASIDFFRTAMKGFISPASAGTLLSECEQENLPAACRHVERNQDGSLARVVVTNQNFGQARVRGLDLSLTADVPSSLGEFQGRLLATYLARRDAQPFDGSIVIHQAGSFDTDNFRAYPHWRALAHVGWVRGPWRLTYRLQYIGSFTEAVPLDEFITYRHGIAAVVYHDLECGYLLAANTQLRFGVDDVTGKDPPFVANNSGGNTDSASYRLLGRTYFAQVRVQFH